MLSLSSFPLSAVILRWAIEGNHRPLVSFTILSRALTNHVIIRRSSDTIFACHTFSLSGSVGCTSNWWSEGRVFDVQFPSPHLPHLRSGNILSSGSPLIRKKSGGFYFSLRLGKSQRIWQNGQGNLKKNKKENFLIFAQNYLAMAGILSILSDWKSIEFFCSLRHFYILMFVLENVCPKILKHFVFEVNS